MSGSEIEKAKPRSEIEELGKELERAAGEAAELMNDESAETGTALVHVRSTAPAVKRHMARKKQELAKKQDEVERISDQMRDLMEREMSKALEIVRPLEEMVRRLEEGIWTVNLYLGRDEEIVTLRKGEAAPADTPIHVRQLVLSMDEETAIDPEDNGIDFQDIDQFDEWLLQSEDHVDQVIPDLKGIVAIRPRAEDTKDYGHMWANIQAGEMDKHTYFLIRNGDALYRLWTSFSVGDYMIPPADEFTNLFRKRRFNFETREHETEQLEPDSFEFERAEEEAEKRQRHYMRMGLVLQGLVDRTAIFHPLPEEGVNFLAAESHSEGTVRFIMDAEDTLSTGREPFDQWMRRINGELRPGMRIVGAFEGAVFREANEYEREGRLRYGHSRLRPGSATSPDSWVPLTIDGRSGRWLTVRFKRTDKRWDRWDGQQPYKKKASVLIEPGDQFVIAIDFADADLMEEYLRARTEREHYLTSFPLLKAAIRVKRAEEAAEEPFRKLIAAQLVLHNEVTIEEAQTAVPKLVEWWKFKNRQHRALTGDGEDKKALTEIVAEHANRMKLDKTATPPELLQKLQAAHPDALVIGRRPDGKHIVLKPEDDRQVFVAIGVYNKKGEVKEQKRWKLSPRNILSWRIFYESAAWKTWRRGASLSDYLTGPEMKELGESLVEDDAIAVTYAVRSNEFEVWKIDPITVPRKPRVRHDYVRREWLATDHVWKREHGVPKLEPATRWQRDHHYSGERPFEAKGRSQYGETRIVLYKDTAAIEKQERRFAQAEEIEEEGRALAHIFSRIDSRIDEQWIERAEKKMFDEFMEEYGDAELWEGHRKTLDDPRVPDELDLDFLIPLIEDRRDIDGLTLGQAAAQAGAEINPEFADFTIDTKPEPEEEEEEEDAYDL